ncbi:MAG: hypothetical protein JWO53_448 [Chlamydiia bacterium]|nr:hypothetical protein [Chlamydiia bacterium]
MSVIVCSSLFQNHLTGRGHPECPERYSTIYNALLNAGFVSDKNFRKPRLATKDELLLCHTEEYVELVEREVLVLQQELRFLTTGDVVISPASYDTALFAVGAVLTAVDAVMTGDARSAFCLVRPPGHHACRFQGMGFCLFNNVAIGARYMQKKYGLKRVLIVDWDVHHGNGTEDIVQNDDSIFYFSTHQAGIYPGTGMQSTPTILNCPITGGVGSREKVLEAFDRQLKPAMALFKPECIFISCGFDGHADDPLGGFDLRDKDFYDLTEILKEIAHLYANDRIISVLEGGYNLSAIARSSVQHLLSLNMNIK